MLSPVSLSWGSWKKWADNLQIKPRLECAEFHESHNKGTALTYELLSLKILIL